MEKIIRSRNIFNENGILDYASLRSCITEHKRYINDYQKYYDYYDGKQAIRNKVRENTLNDNINNKYCVNLAKDNIQTTKSYLLGNGVVYDYDDALSEQQTKYIKGNFLAQNIEAEDSKMALWSTIQGVAYELVQPITYYDEVTGREDLTLEFAPLMATECFYVYDDSVLPKAMMAIYYKKHYNHLGDFDYYIMYVYTKNLIMVYHTTEIEQVDKYQLVQVDEHNFNDIPIIKFCGNEQEESLIKDGIDLYDAYNALSNDNFDDIEQTINSLILMKGFRLGEDSEEELRAVKQLKALGIMYVPENGDVNTLQRQLNIADVTELKKQLKEEICQIVGVPNMSDENFANNVSGVAMGYKLLKFNAIISEKEKWFIDGLKQRLKLMCKFYNQLKLADLEYYKIKPIMKRTLPTDKDMLAQRMDNLYTQGLLTSETILRTIEGIDNVKKEAQLAWEEKINREKQTQEIISASYLSSQDYDGASLENRVDE